MRKLIILMLLACCAAMTKDFTDKNKYLFGAYARVGAPMGVGLEFALPIAKGESIQWYNFFGIESFGVKLIDTNYDSAVLFFTTK